MTNETPEQTYDEIAAGLAPILATLAKLARAQHVAPPVLVTQSNGTLAIVPQQAPALTGFLAAEKRAYEQVARKDARWRARTYMQAPKRAKIEADARRAREWARKHGH